MRHKLPECVLLFDRLVSVHFNSSKHRIMQHQLMLRCRNPAPDLPPLYSSSYACSAAALNLQQNYWNTSVIVQWLTNRCRYSSWKQTPNVSSYQLCNVAYLAPPTDFYYEKQLFSPKNGDLLTLLGVSALWKSLPLV